MRISLLKHHCTGLAAAAAVIGTGSPAHAALFADTFGTSTLNSATPAAPTATSTNYQVLSSKDATGSSIAAGSLQLNMANTSSGFAEVQALFASAPVTLASAGQYVELALTFTASGVNQAGNSTFNVGLYNSGGAGPVPGTSLNNGQLDDPGSFTTGNAAGWLGYVSRIGLPTGAATQIFTRPAQVGETSNEAQDALFSNAGGGAFDNPTGTTIQAGGTGVTFSTSTTYTLTMRITNNGSGVDILFNLGDGVTTLSTLTGADAAPLASGFDALAFGYRGTDSTGPFAVNMSSIIVNTNVPEPASLALLGAGGLLCLRRRPA